MLPGTILPIEEVMPALIRGVPTNNIVIRDTPIKILPVLLLIFKTHSISCTCCNQRATHFISHDKYIKLVFAHTTSTGKPVYMTVDHIIPKALGGLDNISNMQLTCSVCNFAKADSIEYKADWVDRMTIESMLRFRLTTDYPRLTMGEWTSGGYAKIFKKIKIDMSSRYDIDHQVYAEACDSILKTLPRQLGKKMANNKITNMLKAV